MAQRGIDVVRAHLAKLPPSASLTIEERRAQYDRAERLFPTPPDVAIDRVAAPIRPAERLTPPGVRGNAVILYLHGGGYVIGSPRSHRHLAAAVARASGARALLLDYRLAPENPFPAALDDAVAAYDWLLGRRRPHGRHAARPARPGPAAARRGRLHLAVGRSHVQRAELREQGRGRSDRDAGERDAAGESLRRRQRREGPADLAALRGPGRPPAAPRARGQRRSAARRRARPRRARAQGGRRRHAGGVAGHDPRLALVPADARGGGTRHPGHRRVRARAHGLSGARGRMDFEVTYTDEQQRFRGEVRAWLAAHVPGGITRKPVDDADSLARYRELRALGRKLGERGWLYSRAPAQYGGGGLDVDHAIILEEEADRLGLALPPYYDSGGRLGSATILVWGTEEQKQAFLPPIYRGEVRTWQLLTEPGAGSDLAGVTTAAIRDGDEYVINGQK